MAKREVYLTWEGKQRALDADRPRHRCRVEEHWPAPEVPLPSEPIPTTAPPFPKEAGRIVHGDAIDIACALLEDGWGQQIDAVYFDPPYASGVDYSHEERWDGSADGRVAKTTAYGDKWEDAASYLDMLFPRILAIRALLKDTGAVWIQVDWRANYLVRALCDEIFGRDRFLNEIVWRRAPNLGRQARSGQFGRTLDTIIVYGASSKTRLIPAQRLLPVAKGAARRDETTGRFFTLAPRGDYTDASVARLEREGRVHRSSTGKISIKYWLEEDEQGRLCKRQPVDALWSDILPLRHAPREERTGYPTQKPRALLERIISASAPPGGWVLDLFAGSGTTGAAAMRLGRRFILGDASPVAIAAMRSRLLREGASLCVESCGRTLPLAVASARAERWGDDLMRVTFSCPSGFEPSAWAIDLGSGPMFRAFWRAERSTGRGLRELVREAFVPHSDNARVRVYFVDGAIADAPIVLATDAPAHPTHFEAAT